MQDGASICFRDQGADLTKIDRREGGTGRLCQLCGGQLMLTTDALEFGDH